MYWYHLRLGFLQEDECKRMCNSDSECFIHVFLQEAEYKRMYDKIQNIAHKIEDTVRA